MKKVVLVLAILLLIVITTSYTVVGFSPLSVEGQAGGDPTIKWFGDCKITTSQLNSLGIEFVMVTVGGIETGEYGIVGNPDGTTSLVPLTEQGVAIQFTTMPSEETLLQIDALLPSCEREGKVMTVAGLPHSMHVAALSKVYLVSDSPRCDVIRLYEGVQYTVTGCRVAQSAYDAYTSGKIVVYNPAYGLADDHNKDCFVLVYFITETPFGSGDSIELPVIVDKIIK